MRILLIEDNDDHAILCRMALSEGHDVVTAVTLGEGLSLLAAVDFDAVLSDLTLPDGEGATAVERVREVAPSTPLVVLTNHNSQELEDSVIRHGAQDFLLKSQVLVSAKTARSAINRALHHAIHRQQSLDEQARLVGELRDSQLQLQKQNDQLSELCKTAQKFVDNVSHEFRTPLTIIREYASLIREGVVGDVNAQQAEMLNVLEDRSDDLNTMIDDMLDVSRLESGIVSVRRKECSLRDVLDRLMPPLLRKAEVRKIDLDLEADEELPLIWADAEKLSRTLINLVVNAIKFCGQPGVVRVGVEHDPVAAEVSITVKDNGPGIPADQCEMIYERFRQPVAAVRQSTKGFGLGLGIAKDLVDLNLGKMFLHSVVGEGSTFGFTVPIADPRGVLDRYLQRLVDAETQGMTRLVELTADTTDTATSGDIEKLIEMQLFRDDQLFAISDGRWAAVMIAPSFEQSQFEERLMKGHARQSRNRPRGPLPEVSVREVGCWQLTADTGSPLAKAFDALLSQPSAKPDPSREGLAHA
ncbi:MAG: hybrid sensor histidine kinase/response regulator [Planctomycetota bacterium]